MCAAPNPRRGSDGRACGMRFTPSAAKGLGAGVVVLVSPLPPSSTPPSLIFGAVADSGEIPKAAARYRGRLVGRLLVGWLLGFEGASGRCRCGTGGTRRPSGAPALQGAAAMGSARCSRRLPCPHGFVTGRTTQEEGKGGGKKGLTGGPTWR
jgi:hypothetical protein